jgi:hypothetical protein
MSYNEFLDEFCFGSDFELPVYDKQKRSYVSAQGLLPGTKEDPFDINFGAIQVDCTNAEFNIRPITFYFYEKGNHLSRDLAQTFLNRVSMVKRYTEFRYLPTHKYTLMARGAVIYKKLNNPKDWIFGCDPDYNAWLNGEINEKPDPLRAYSVLLRTAATHFHFSHPVFEDKSESNRFARLFDLYVTLPFLFIDLDTRRRQLYGKAGAIRYTRYGDKPGVEIRTISSKILDKNIYVYKMMTNMVRSIKAFYDGDDITHEVIPMIINNHDLEKASKIVKKLELL